jgi:predicted  nucleic acid-binding Zn-ribbon protein
LDLKIERCKKREAEIPKQKNKFDVQRQRLVAEIEEREEAIKALQLEQRDCEGAIGQHQEQIAKYETQLLAVKKNEEYTALLHEIDGLKKQIGQKEERIINIMMELDEARDRLTEDKSRVQGEMAEIDKACAEIDAELSEAVKDRNELEEQRKPYLEAVEKKLLDQYTRIRANKGPGAAVVELRGQMCMGCHMTVIPQVANEVLGGKVHACAQCGRLLYVAENFQTA